MGWGGCGEGVDLVVLYSFKSKGIGGLLDFHFLAFPV